MRDYFIDTNIFLRLIVEDGSSQHKEAEKIFLEASENKFHLFTSVIVFFEIYWVLTSFYKKNKKEVSDILENILEMSFVEIADRKIIDRAVSYFKNHNLELEDCYNLFYTLENKSSGILTFDKKLKNNFDRIQV